MIDPKMLTRKNPFITRRLSLTQAALLLTILLAASSFLLIIVAMVSQRQVRYTKTTPQAQTPAATTLTPRQAASVEALEEVEGQVNQFVNELNQLEQFEQSLSEPEVDFEVDF